MKFLAAYISPLGLVDQARTQQNHILDKISAKQIERRVQKSETRRRKQEETMNRKLAKYFEMSQGQDNNIHYPSASSGLTTISTFTSGSGRREEVDLTPRDRRSTAVVEENKRKEMVKADRKHGKSKNEMQKQVAKLERRKEKELARDLEDGVRMEFLILERF